MESRTEKALKKTVVLAPDEEGREKIFGLPAVRRLILLHRQLGVEEIHLVGRVKTLEPLVRDLVPPERLHPAEGPAALDRVVQNLALAAGDRVLAMKANHVIDRPSLARFLEAGNRCGLYVLEAKGKEPERLFSAAAEDLAATLQYLWTPSSQPALTKRAQRVAGLDGFPYAVNRDTDPPPLIERKLMEAQASQTRESDGFLARHVNRRVSRFITRRLIFTPVTPNHVTVIGATTGLAGAFLLSLPGYWPKVLGALLFLCSIIVDGVDGEIARLKLQATSFGHYLDIVSDNLVHIAVFLGITLGLYRDSGNPLWFALFAVLLGGFACCGVAVYQCILKPHARPLQESGRTLRLLTLLSNRDFAYIIVVLALAGRLSWFISAAAFGTYIFAALLWMVGFHEQRAAAR